MKYEQLLDNCEKCGVAVYEINLLHKGLYSDRVIGISKNIPTSTEKACILAEELGHYHTTAGNILDQSNVCNRKQERYARTWAYILLVPLTSFIKAHYAGVTGRHELAEFLEVTEEFLQEAVDYYVAKHGLYVKVDKHIIYFDPLGVLRAL